MNKFGRFLGIMNKFGRFLGRISAETCLKMDYFGSKPQKSPSARCFAFGPPCLRWLEALPTGPHSG